MPAARVYSRPTKISSHRACVCSPQPSLRIAKSLCTIAHATVAMSAFVRQKPRRSYMSDKKDLSTYEKRSNTPKVQVEESCPICQEPIGVRNKEGITECWSILPCGHQFGSYCIKHYLRVVADDRPSCPICRQPTYHTCGHPYLPRILDPSDNEAGTIAKLSDTWIERMRTTSCVYCRLVKNEAPVWKAKTRRGTIWRSAGSWLLSLATRPRRLLRHRNRNEEVLRGPLLIPWQEDDAYGGPWIDPFPRQRDPVWERWWDSQEPKERNPAEGFR